MIAAYVAMGVCRAAFVLENWSAFGPWLSGTLLWSIFKGGLVFDTSALLYVNALWLIALLFPLHLKESPAFHRGLRALYVATNGLACAANLIDSVFFQFTGRRTTVTVFSEFQAEGNITSIILTEAVRHWYLVALFAAIVWCLWKSYRLPQPEPDTSHKRYYLTQTLALLALTPLAIIGIRGSATAGTRPITISNANQYVNRPVEATAVLNTPFSLIRSIGKKPFVTPDYFPAEQLPQVYSPIITPVADSLSRPGKNVVILVVESLGREYVGALNPKPYDGGYTPFVDSLVAQSATWSTTIANGRISMDAMPSILCGLPMMVEPFFLTPASLNDIEGLPHQLAPLGYHTAFFHGAHNISMGFSAFAHAIGFDQYFGLDEYRDDPNYNGMDDFDGKWAIWDEPFLQFSLDRINGFRQPFLATIFTASSHHPFRVPEQYRDSLRDEGGSPIHKCVRYTDLALRRFFQRARRQPWFSNTIFVLVADHTNQSTHTRYLTDIGRYEITLLFHTPDGQLNAGTRPGIAQQTDISPTLLHLLGYTRQPFVCFGSDLLATPPTRTWAMNYNSGTWQYMQDSVMIQFDGTRTTAAYNYIADPLLRHRLDPAPYAAYERRLRAIIQQYMSRMNENRLLVRQEQ